MVKCKDNTFYCGITNDIDARITTHNRKRGAKYTRSRTPVALIYKEECADKSSALKREHKIKKMTRKEKENLILESKMARVL